MVLDSDTPFAVCINVDTLRTKEPSGVEVNFMDFASRVYARGSTPLSAHHLGCVVFVFV